MIQISEQFPPEGAKDVSPSTMIEFRLSDSLSTIIDGSIIVLVNGNFAVKDGLIQDGYDGIGASITPDINGFLISISPEYPFELSDNVLVKVQAKNDDGKFFNHEYSFHTTKQEPQLIYSSPKNNDIVSLPQIIYMHFEDSIDGINSNTINIDINQVSYVVDGQIQTNVNGFLTEIIDNSNDVVIKIDPKNNLQNGEYKIDYSIEDTLGNLLVSDLSFKVMMSEVVLPDFFPQTGFVGFYQGVFGVADNGDGESLTVSVSQPISRSYKSESFVLVYQADNHNEVFDGNPKYMLRHDIRNFLVPELEPGKQIYFGARAMEVYKDSIDTSGMQEIEEGAWVFPGDTYTTSFLSSDDLVVPVSSTFGFPSVGFLKIGSEVLKYSSKDDENFYISTNGRGVSDTTPGIYFEDEQVSLFTSCQDDNKIIIACTPTYSDGYSSGRALDEVGVNVTDYTDNDRTFFQGFDYCGYHHALPFRTLNGKDDCGSYLGGEYNGFKGFNLYDQMLNNEEALLENVGEPVILLKRIWNGEKCSCMNLRKISPRQRTCGECYGTGFAGGYQQFSNTRRQDRRIMVKMQDSAEDLKHGEKEHLTQEFEPQAWTLALPSIRDRDLIIRFDFTENREFIYEVLDVSREKMIFRKYGRQNLRLKRLDVTDIVYSIPYTRNF